MEPLDRRTLEEAARDALGSTDKIKALLADGVLTLLHELKSLSVDGPKVSSVEGPKDSGVRYVLPPAPPLEPRS